MTDRPPPHAAPRRSGFGLHHLRRYSFLSIVRILFYSLALLLYTLLRLPAFYLRMRAYRRRVAGGDAAQPGVFFYSQVVWQEVWQRPQEASLRFSERVPVVFISPLQIHRLFDSVPRRIPYQRLDTPHGVHVHQPMILPGEYKLRPIRWLNRLIVQAETLDIFHYHGRPEIFLTNSPFSGRLSRAFDWRLRVYDIIDDFVKCVWAPPESEALEREQLAQCDLVLTGTHQLYETKKHLHETTRFVPLGVDFDAFQHDAPPPIPADLAEIPAPRLGYIGSLSERIDPAILAGLAQKYPAAQLVLIGPMHGSFGTPPQAPNIHYLGPRSHEELPRYLAHFDLALIPFRLNEMTASLNPIKTLEYLAAGKVVIATALPDIERFYGDVAVLARSAEEFVEKTGEWLARDRTEREAQGREIARGHSWEAMADAMWREIERALENKAASSAAAD